MLPRGTPSGSTGRAGTNKGCHFGWALNSQSAEARIGWMGRPVREPRERGLFCVAAAPIFAICSPDRILPSLKAEVNGEVLKEMQGIHRRANCRRGPRVICQEPV